MLKMDLAIIAPHGSTFVGSYTIASTTSVHRKARVVLQVEVCIQNLNWATDLVDGIVHYCVANMPGAVARTSTLALTSVTQNYGLRIAVEDVEGFCQGNAELAQGLNVYKGECTYEAVAKAHGLDFTPWFEAMKVAASS